MPHRIANKSALLITGLILEVLQGPCELNQAYFCSKTNLLEVLNRMMRARTKNDEREADKKVILKKNSKRASHYKVGITPCHAARVQKELKNTTVKIFRALLEGRPSSDELFEKIAGVVHLDVLMSHVELPVLKALAEVEDLGIGDDLAARNEPPPATRKRISSTQVAPEPGNVLAEDEDSDDDVEEMQESLQQQILVILRMFCDFDPRLKADKTMIRINDLIYNEVQSIEVVWNGRLQRCYFHIPSICALIGETTKKELVESVDRGNDGNHLKCLVGYRPSPPVFCFVANSAAQSSSSIISSLKLI